MLDLVHSVDPQKGLNDASRLSASTSTIAIISTTVPDPLAITTVINCSFHQVFYYSFTFLLPSFSVYSVGNSVTLCDIMRDMVTSKVTSQDMSHIVWLGVWDN